MNEKEGVKRALPFLRGKGVRSWARALGLALAVSLVVFLCWKPSLLEGYSFSRRVSGRNGEMLRLTLSADEKYRIFTPLSQFSPILKEAALLKEDRYFFRHPGVNPIAAVRAFFSTYLFGAKRIGASTISMQLARLRFELSTRSVPRKIWQMLRALQLELQKTRRQSHAGSLQNISKNE